MIDNEKDIARAGRYFATQRNERPLLHFQSALTTPPRRIHVRPAVPWYVIVALVIFLPTAVVFLVFWFA